MVYFYTATSRRYRGVMWSIFAPARLHFCFRRIGYPFRWQGIRQIKPSHANPAVGHPIVDIETVWRAKIVAPVDARGEHDVCDGSVALLRQSRRQHRLLRAKQNQNGLIL